MDRLQVPEYWAVRPCIKGLSFRRVYKFPIKTKPAIFGLVEGQFSRIILVPYEDISGTSKTKQSIFHAKVRNLIVTDIQY